MEEISNVDAIIEIILRDARARTKVDYSNAVIEVLADIITRCNEILDQVPSYEMGLSDHEKKNP